MNQLTEILNERLTTSIISEALIKLGHDSKFGNVVIFAGGSGSGKGWIRKNLLNIDGKVLDVDKLKSLALRSIRLKQLIFDQTGIDISNFDLKIPAEAGQLHQILGKELRLQQRYEEILFSSILLSHTERKPNLIFDVTLQSIEHLKSICDDATKLGYDKAKIHIIWVVNDVEVSLEQNASRDRVIDASVLKQIHFNVSKTMQMILDLGHNLSGLLDGYIIFAFNKIHVDTSTVTSKHGGSYIDKANYVTVKEPRKTQLSSSDLSSEILMKLKDYTKILGTVW